MLSALSKRPDFRWFAKASTSLCPMARASSPSRVTIPSTHLLSAVSSATRDSPTNSFASCFSPFVSPNPALVRTVRLRRPAAQLARLRALRARCRIGSVHERFQRIQLRGCRAPATRRPGPDPLREPTGEARCWRSGGSAPANESVSQFFAGVYTFPGYQGGGWAFHSWVFTRRLVSAGIRAARPVSVIRATSVLTPDIPIFDVTRASSLRSAMGNVRLHKT